MKKVLLLGASGSIGSQTLDIIDKYPNDFVLVGVSVGHNDQKLNEILAKYKTLKYAFLLDSALVAPLKKKYPKIAFYSGEKELGKFVKKANYDMCVDALVGISGLEPAYICLKKGKILCLANKETLVAGGTLINATIAKYHGKMYPIDSEHVAIQKCLSKTKRSDVKRLILTASGGALRNVPLAELPNMTAKDALNHPTWKMGEKITIDCATMMNKGFEIIEAYYLFDFPLSKIDILMHDESLVHSLVELKDGTFLVDYGKPDMHGPIEYAMFEGKIDFKIKHIKSLSELADCHFHSFDPERYPCVGLAKKALEEGGTQLVVLNASNEVAVHLFLGGAIKYDQIYHIIDDVMSRHKAILFPNLKEIRKIDIMARGISVAVAAKK